MSVALPTSWTETPIGTLCVNTEQVTPDAEAEFIYVDIASVDRETKKITSPQRMLGKDAPSRARKLIKVGDTIVSTTRPNLNAVALVDQTLDGQIASTGFDVLRAPGLDPRWLGYLVRTSAFVDAMSSLVQGALYPAIRGKDVRSFVAPIAPANEQERIADKLDTVLTRVDAVNTRLARVAPLLKRFRQSVLAAATSGRLTEDWRGSSTTQQSQRPSTESWQQLAERMRLTAWLKYAKERQDTNDQAVAKRYKAAQSIATDHDSLPEGWQKVCADQMTFLITDGKHGDCENQDRSGYFFLSVKDLRNGALDYKSARQITKKDFDEVDFRTSLQAGDVLITNAGTIGRVAVVRDQALARRSTLQKSIAVLKPIKELLVPDFLAFCLQSKISLLNDQASGTAVKNLLLSDLRKVAIELPPKDEQTEIVRRVETLFAFADRLEARLAQAQTAATRLTPALLAKAFRGELVQQDPNDEPAAELLRRLTKPQTQLLIKKHG